MESDSDTRVGQLLDPIRSLFQRYEEPEVNDHSVAPSQLKRWKEYNVHFPEDHNQEHEASWTGAPGVWYCRDCHEWFRTWEETPHRPERQEAGF